VKRYKGTVKNNVVVLEAGTHLPEGTEVEVRVPSRRRRRDEEAFRRLLSDPITRPVGMEEIIEEDKKEREERWDVGGNPGQ
jgi:hypothetical protein